ncbi:MAG: two-component regulator propeller domain-containing protein [Bacteroidales bacterium]
MTSRFLLLVFLCVTLGTAVHGQEGYLRFRQLTINEGLSLSSVYCIYQDSKGFLWFGTEDGLNKYDGQSIQVLGSAEGQHDVLSNKWIELIYEDKSGMIWLGTRGGLTRYDPRKEAFSILRHDPENPSTLSNDSVTCILSDLNQEIWVGTFSGLNRVDRITNSVTRIQPAEESLRGLRSRINAMLLDRSGTLWIATCKGLFSYDGKSGLFFNERAGGLLAEDSPIHSMALSGDTLWLGTDLSLIRMELGSGQRQESHPLSAGQAPCRPLSMHVDHLGQVWVQSDGGLYCYLPATGETRRLWSSRGENHSLALVPIPPLHEDRHGYLWHGTFGDGVFRIDPSTLEYRHFTHNPADPTSIAENAIHCIYEDRGGALWFGSFGAGISMLDPLANKFTLYKHDPFNRNSPASSFIWSLYETKDGNIWLGTNDNGVSVLDRQTGEFRHLGHRERQPNSLSHQSVRKIYQDSHGKVWIGTDGGGLDLYRPETNDFVHFRHRTGQEGSLSDNSVRAIYEDPHGQLWVGTRRGLNRYDSVRNRFQTYVHDENDPTSLSHNFIYSALYMDREDNLWIGTYGGGLCRLLPDNGLFITYDHDPDDPTSISDNIVYSIFEDGLGRFWIGTNNGLNMFYPATGAFRRFGIGEGLPNEVIYGIVPDDENRIWLSTNLGICRFDLETFEAKNYDRSDGLQSNEFNGGAYGKLADGRILFGGVYGFNIIQPHDIPPERNATEVTLTQLDILGKRVQVAGVELEEFFEENPGQIAEFDGQFYCGENPTYLEEIVLDYRHRYFSVEFRALNNQQSANLSYAYMLENLETEWNQAGRRNFVSYANLRAGSYTLHVVAENKDGVRSNAPLDLHIVVTPPFWLSWWFILLEVLLALAIAVMIYTYLLKTRTNRLLTRQNQQISEANQALRESERNLMELNATKDKFFSIISHDLKNPFSSLLSISELMVDSFEQTDEDDHRAGFRKIHESVKHLLSLLENLLTWSRSQRGRIKYEPVRFNLAKLVQENINIHRLQAERKGIILCASGAEDVFAFGDRDMINSVLHNLVTNAVKFTEQGKKVEVQLSPSGEGVEVRIVDEGVGIPAEQVDKLFRIDEKYKSTGTAGEKGTGLGLIICREFVEKNGGAIQVRSEQGKGSTFSFTLPLAN